MKKSVADNGMMVLGDLGAAGAAQALAGVLEDIFDQINQVSETERRDLTRQKERLEAEQLKLLQAHYADAISLPVLKKEQDRISNQLATITSRLDAYQTSQDETRTNLRAYLGLATDSHALYTICDEHHRRRMLNQAFFTKITITDATK